MTNSGNHKEFATPNGYELFVDTKGRHFYFPIGKSMNDVEFVYQRHLDVQRQKHYFSNLSDRKTVWKLPKLSEDNEESARVEQQVTEVHCAVEIPAIQVTNEKILEPPVFAATLIVDQAQKIEKERSRNLITNSVPEIQIEEPTATTDDDPTVESKYLEQFPSELSDCSSFDSRTADEKLENSDLPKSNSSSFNENTDAFEDFTFAASHTQKRRISNEIEFQKSELLDSDTGSEEVTTRSSFTGRSFLGSTLLGLSEPISRDRGEIEIQVESDIFCDINSGEVHVIAAIQCYYHLTPHKKKRELVHVSIARDWTGAFVLCISRTAMTKKNRLVISCYPLIENFKIQVLETVRQSCRFILGLDRTALLFVSGVKSKEKLEKYLKYAFGEIHKFSTDEEVILNRMASVDFAKFVESLIPNPEKCSDILQGLLMDYVSDVRTALSLLQKFIRFPTVRDMVLTQLLGFIRSDDYSTEKAGIVLDVYNETISSPTSTSYPNLGNEFIEIFHEIIKAEQEKDVIGEMLRQEKAEKEKLLREQGLLVEEPKDANKLTPDKEKRKGTFQSLTGALSGESFKTEEVKEEKPVEDDIPCGNQRVIQRARTAIAQTETISKIIPKWKSRGHLPDSPFPPEFLYVPKTVTISRKCDKEKEKLRQHFHKNGEGVSLAVLFFTDEEILADPLGMLPSVKLKNSSYSSFQSADLASEELDWLYNLGKDWSVSACDFVNLDKRKSFSPFKRDVVKAANELTTRFNVDLGILYDRVIVVPDYEGVLVLTFKRIQDKRQVQIGDKFSWQSKDLVEHRLYQGYNDLPPTSRLDKLESNFYGQRWVGNGIVWHDQFQSNQLGQGLYLCHLRFCVDSTGFRVLVRDDLRMMPPCLKISSGLPARQDWEWVQSIRLKSEKNIPILPSSLQVTLETPIEECTSFRQQFLRGVLELQQQLSLESLGKLYDEEIVLVDQDNKLMLICFVENVSTTTWNTNWSNKFLWRKLTTVENTNAYTFMGDISSVFKEYVLKFHSQSTSIQECELTKDEAYRRVNEQSDISLLLRAESVWSVMRWMTRLINWCQKGATSIADSIKDKDAIIDIDQEIRRISKKISPVGIEIRKQILSRKMTDTWEQICLSLKPLGTGTTKIQKVRERYRPSFITKKRVHISDPIEEKEEQVEEETQQEEQPQEVSFKITPPNTHFIECSIEDIYKSKDLVIAPTSQEVCRCFAEEIVEQAMVKSEGDKELSVIRNTIEGMVSIIETMETLSEEVEIVMEQERKALVVLEERHRYRDQLYNLFEEIGIASMRDDEDREVAVSEVNASYDKYVREMVAQFNSSIESATALYKVACGVQECIELVDIFDTFDKSLTEQEEIFKQTMQQEDIFGEFLVEEPPLVTSIQSPVVDGEMVDDAIQYTFSGDVRLGENLKKTAERSRKIMESISPDRYSAIESSSVHTATVSHAVSAAVSSTWNEPQGKQVRRTVDILTKDDITFHVQIIEGFNVERCEVFKSRAILGALHVPYHSTVVEVVVEYLLTDDIPSFLGMLEDRVKLEGVDVMKLFAMVKEFEIAPLYIALTPQLPKADTHETLLKFANSFLLDTPLNDWVQWEKLFIYIKRSSTLIDQLFFVRYMSEFDSDDIYIDHKKRWKRVYSEARISMFFTHPNKFQKKYFADQRDEVKKELIQNEIILWKKYLGKNVKKLNVSSKTAFGDREVQVISATCPQLIYINLSKTSVTDEAIQQLLSTCPKLKHIVLTKTRVSLNQITAAKRIVKTVEHD